MPRIIDWISRVLAYLAMGLLIFMMLFITVSVCGRYFFSQPIPDDLIIMQALLVVVVFLPFAYVQIEKAHLSVTILTDRMPPMGRFICEQFGLLIGIIFMAIVAAASFGDAQTAFNDGAIFEGTLEIPEWPARGSVFVGTGLLFLKLLVDFIQGFVEGPSKVQVSSLPDH